MKRQSPGKNLRMKKKSIVKGSGKLVWFAFSCLLLCGGCASHSAVTLAVNQGKPISLTPYINKDYRVVKHIRVQQKVPLLFVARLSPGGGKPDFDELLRPELISNEGDALVNVKIVGEASLGDVLLPIGLGIISGIGFAPLYVIATAPLFEDLKTYSVEGDLVQYIDRQPESERKFDPATGTQKAKPRFDPETGLPMKP